jgi:hypothetical protein
MESVQLVQMILLPELPSSLMLQEAFVFSSTTPLDLFAKNSTSTRRMSVWNASLERAPQLMDANSTLTAFYLKLTLPTPANHAILDTSSTTNENVSNLGTELWKAVPSLTTPLLA